MALSFYDQQEQCHDQLLMTEYSNYPFVFVSVTPPSGWIRVPLCVQGSFMYLPEEISEREIRLGTEPTDAILPDDAVPPDAAVAALEPVVTSTGISVDGCTFKATKNATLPPSSDENAPKLIETCKSAEGSDTLAKTCAKACSKNVLCSVMLNITNSTGTIYELWQVYMVEAAGMSLTNTLYLDTPPMNCQLNNLELLINSNNTVLYKTSCCACPTCSV